MVNSQIWLDQNYPATGACIRVEDKENYGKTRDQIVNLDISKQNLENGLQLGSSFPNLKTLNCSFNSLTGLSWNLPSNLEELDESYNLLAGNNFHLQSSPNIKKLNFSHNSITAFYFETPNLAYLDATSNLLNILDLHSTPNLVELKCSNNPISNLTLTQSSKLVLFDCLGVKLDKNNVSTPTSSPLTPSTSLFPTVTIYSKDPTLLGSIIGL
ncbi:33308_t:CDS:1, partial [Racocetra persica]